VARRRAAGLADTPLAVLLSRTFDFPWEAQLFTAEDQPVLLYAGTPGEVPSEVAAPVEVVPLAEPSPSAAMADLRARGVRALLCEGGPTLNRSLLAAGVVDELFLTIAPLLTGDDEQLRIVQGAPLSAPARLRLIWALQQVDELYLRYAVLHEG
jgi:riboflavin biosynthesis pyrimidine reductase